MTSITILAPSPIRWWQVWRLGWWNFRRRYRDRKWRKAWVGGQIILNDGQRRTVVDVGHRSITVDRPWNLPPTD